MTAKRMALQAGAFALAMACCGCRFTKENVVGSYYVHGDGVPQTLALNLNADGTFAMYRTVNFGEGPGEVTVYKSSRPPSDEISGSGKWQLQHSPLIPGAESIHLEADRFVYILNLVKKDGLTCVKVAHDHQPEYWCKPE